MPRYEFACPAGHVTEVRRPADDADLPDLCHCGSPSARVPSFRTVATLTVRGGHKDEYGAA